MRRLSQVLDESKPSDEWFVANKVSLFSIISSIGMLQLRDTTCLDKLCEILATSCDEPRILINFIITCGSLSYGPHSLDKLIKKIKPRDFFNKSFFTLDSREKMFLLNYVWSLCMLNKASSPFIEEVLYKKFWEEFIEDSKLYLLIEINLP